MCESIVIEFGSNACKVLQKEGNTVKADYRIPLRLISSLDEQGLLSETAVQNMINITSDVIRRFPNSKHYLLIATEAMRRAKNSALVQETIHKETGLQLNILSSQAEAEASFKGVLSGLSVAGKTVVFDIGGASTEIIHGLGDAILQANSYPLGAVSFSTKYRRNDPIQHCGYNAIEKEINRHLKLKIATDITLIGTGGALSTMAAVDAKLANFDSDKLNCHILTRAEVYRQLQIYRGFPVAEIVQIPGMDPSRADIILPAVMITLKIMDALGQRKLVVSTRGVRHGVQA